jgi:pheromone shutdown protein TraB
MKIKVNKIEIKKLEDKYNFTFEDLKNILYLYNKGTVCVASDWVNDSCYKLKENPFYMTYISRKEVDNIQVSSTVRKRINEIKKEYPRFRKIVISTNDYLAKIANEISNIYLDTILKDIQNNEQDLINNMEKQIDFFHRYYKNLGREKKISFYDVKDIEYFSVIYYRILTKQDYLKLIDIISNLINKTNIQEKYKEEMKAIFKSQLQYFN